LLLVGCVIPPDPLPVVDEEKPLIHIDKELIEPLLSAVDPINRGLIAQFDVRTAVITRDVTNVLHYTWYGDLNETSGIALPFYHACGNTSLCQLAPCNGLKKVKEIDHKLMLIVSDGPLRKKPEDTFDFEEGVAFDWVEWSLKLEGDCP